MEMVILKKHMTPWLINLAIPTSSISTRMLNPVQISGQTLNAKGENKLRTKQADKWPQMITTLETAMDILNIEE